MIWLLEELGGIEYEIESYRLGDPRLRSSAYRAMNPAGKVPTFEDEGVAFHESGAIVQYLLERHGRGRLEPAPSSPTRGPFLQWMHWSEASLLPPLAQINAHKFVLREADRIPQALDLARRQFAKVLGQLGAALDGADYLVENRFTAADLMVGYGVALARMVGELPEGPSAVHAWFDRLAARPAFERAFAGGFGGG